MTVDSPALADLTRRVNGAVAGAAASLTVEASLGRIARRMDREAADERDLQRAVQPVVLPAVRLLVAAGVLGTDPALSLLGPEDGQAWDVRRLTVAGLIGPSGTQQQASGSVTSPAAGATIASIGAAVLVPGVYLVQWAVELDGTAPTAVDLNNFRIQGPGQFPQLTSINDAAIGRYPQPSFQGTIFQNPGSPVKVIAVATGTVGTIYSAQISLTPVAGDFVSLYREIGGAGGGNAENLLWTFTAAGTSPGPTWNPGGGLIMRSPEGLLLSGTGLAAASVTLSGEAVAVETPWLSRYLL